MPITLELRLFADEPEALALVADAVRQLRASMLERQESGRATPDDYSEVVAVLPPKAPEAAPAKPTRRGRRGAAGESTTDIVAAYNAAAVAAGAPPIFVAEPAVMH